MHFESMVSEITRSERALWRVYFNQNTQKIDSERLTFFPKVRQLVKLGQKKLHWTLAKCRVRGTKALLSEKKTKHRTLDSLEVYLIACC